MVPLLAQYPLLIYLLIFATCLVLPVVVIMAIIVIRQGREFSTPLFKFGPKEIKQSPQTIGTLIVPGVSGITDEQLKEKIKAVVKETVNEYRAEIKNQPPGQLYQPQNLSNREIYLYAVRKEIKEKLSTIVLSLGHGAWAGISQADLEVYLVMAQDFKVIPEHLVSDIKSFIGYARILLVSGNIPDDSYLEMQYLAAKINAGLNEATIATKNKKAVR